MDNRFDQLTKALAGEESAASAPVSRREALRNVGFSLAAALLASLGLGGRALAAPPPGKGGGRGSRQVCMDYCRRFANKAARDYCQGICESCPSTTMLCGTLAFDLVCCAGTCCAGTCTSLASDPGNCGACGRQCAWFPNVVTTCNAGTCAYSCAPGWVDCDGITDNGCESYLEGDPNNCGACGNRCPPEAPYCSAGECTCPTNTLCSGVCTDVFWDARNCGDCGIVCDEAAGQVCCGGTCMDYCSCYDCGGWWDPGYSPYPY